MKNSIFVAGKEYPIRWTMTVNKQLMTEDGIEKLGFQIESENPAERAEGTVALAKILSMLTMAGAKYYNWIEQPETPYKGLTADEIMDFSTEGEMADFVVAMAKEKEDSQKRFVISEETEKNAVSG